MSSSDSGASSRPDTEGRATSEAPGDPEAVVRLFVEHWGMMARSWGINATMGELFALLYISGTSWTADELRERLRVSRGNVSMNLRELIAWGVVHKVHRPGARREFYRAETDVWTLFRRILGERKRRELDPTVVILQHCEQMIQTDPALKDLEGRLTSLRKFFGMINALATRLLDLKTDDLDELRQLLDSSDRAPGRL